VSTAVPLTTLLKSITETSPAAQFASTEEELSTVVTETMSIRVTMCTSPG